MTTLDRFRVYLPGRHASKRFTPEERRDNGTHHNPRSPFALQGPDIRKPLPWAYNLRVLNIGKGFTAD